MLNLFSIAVAKQITWYDLSINGAFIIAGFLMKQKRVTFK